MLGLHTSHVFTCTFINDRTILRVKRGTTENKENDFVLSCTKNKKFFHIRNARELIPYKTFLKGEQTNAR